MVNALNRFVTLAVAVSLVSPVAAQMRVSGAVAPVPGLAVPLIPFSSFAAPALLPALPVVVEAGQSYFDGAVARPEVRPVAVAAARAPRGETVALNGIALPARMFSDQTKISEHLVRAIDAATDSIDIAIHGLALREIAAALVRAKIRRVRVRIVMNQTHIFPEKPRDTRSPEVQLLLDQGFEMKMLRGGDMFGVMHNKIAIFDSQILETGSYNWTHAADTWHWENAMFHAEQARIRAYQAYWDWLWSVSSEIPASAPARPTPIPEGQPHPNLPPAPQDPERPIQFNGEAFPAQAFSPGGVTAHLVRAIDAARTSIDLANFSFTSEVLRDALLRAKGRGVAIRIVFDAGQYQFLPEMHWFAQNGFDVLLSRGKDGNKGVMHEKFAVFDGALVEAGSFNWTRNGEKNNYENAIFLEEPDDVAAFAAQFLRIHDQAWAPGAEDHQGPHAAPEEMNLEH